MAVTQNQFVELFTDALNKNSDGMDQEYSKKEVDNILQVLGATVAKEMKKKDDKDKSKFATVPVKYLGRFRLNVTPARKARKGRNPATGEEMMFKAKPKGKKAKFTFDKKIKDTLGSK